MRYNAIEMIGLSGVGKTTMFHNLGDSLFQNIGKYSTVNPIKPPKIYYFYETFLLTVKVITGLGFIQSLPVLRSTHYVRLFLKLGYRIASIKIRNLSGLVYLRDSGVLMPLLSAVIDDRLKLNNTLLFQSLNNIPLPKHVYCIVDSPTDIYSRFIAREKKIGNDVNGYTVTDFKNANIFLSLLIEKLKSIGVNVVVLNKV